MELNSIKDQMPNFDEEDSSMSEMNPDDYIKYRGKCKEMSEALVADDPTLQLVRGWYHCPIWGKQEHWWCKTPEGKIIDPTARQFPSKGIGEYEEFAGIFSCAECGTDVKEENAIFESNYVFCSGRCVCRFVGL